MKIAIVGTGISGMVTAYLLSDSHDLTIFEKNDYIGGHTHTIDVDAGGKTYPVDTGFIVFNEATYPNFVELLRRLDVPWKNSRMSFSLRCEQTGLEFCPSSLDSFFAQRRNLFRPSFHRMVLDIFRFRREALELLKQPDEAVTLAKYLEGKNYSPLFIEKFILPMGAAIWSADPIRFRQFPARYFVEFFHNHGFLNVRNQPQWLVVRGGSKRYVEKLIQPFADRIRLNCAVASIAHREDCVEVRSRTGGVERFDAVVLAVHSDEALALLSDPSEAEKEVLAAIPYQENLTVLHADPSVLPRNRKCWAAWNYHVPRESLGRVTLTYQMNILQGLEAPVEFCVTLNRAAEIDPEKTVRKLLYSHPIYTPEGRSAQRRREEINGARGTYYCGAYWGHGFHEDGVKSALAVCKHFGKGL